MDIERSLSYAFEDKNWVSKLGLGALIGLVPILNFAWTGYTVGIIRSVAAGEREPLPSWDNLDWKFMDGLLLFAAGIIYMLPILLLIGIPAGMMVFSGTLSSIRDAQSMWAWLTEAGWVSLAAVICVVTAYGLVLSIIYPAILVMFAREGTLVSCFKFGEITNLMGRDSGPYFTVWGMSIIAALGIGIAACVLSGFLNLIPCAGWIAGLVISLGSTVYISSVQSHLIGQFSALSRPITAETY